MANFPYKFPSELNSIAYNSHKQQNYAKKYYDTKILYFTYIVGVNHHHHSIHDRTNFEISCNYIVGKKHFLIQLLLILEAFGCHSLCAWMCIVCVRNPICTSIWIYRCNGWPKCAEQINNQTYMFAHIQTRRHRHTESQ